MSENVPLNIQNEYPKSADYPTGNEMDTETSMTQTEAEKEAIRSREISQQLSDLLEKQANHPELPREENNTEGSDKKSVYIGNVDYQVSEQELEDLFSACGRVERVNIMKNKVSGAPKGFAYLEYALQESAQLAVTNLDGALLRDRELKVSLKRTNVPGMSSSGRGSMRGRARGRVRGGIRGRVMRGHMRGRGMPSRFAPY